MGNCKYCGSDVGLLRRSHQECARRHSLGTERIALWVADAASKPRKNIKELKKEIESTAVTSFVRKEDVRRYVIEGWIRAVSDSVKQGNFTEKEEHRLLALAGHFSISKYKSPCRFVWLIFENGRAEEIAREIRRTKQEHKDAINQAIEKGTIIPRWPESVQQFNLLKSEEIIWFFENTLYRTEIMTKSRTQHRSVISPAKYEKVTLDQGSMGVTTKHIYFVGNREQFRIRYNNIVAFKEYKNGVGLKRDQVRAREQIFVTGTDEGRFTFGLVTALAQR